MSYERPNIAAMQGYAYGEQPTDTSVIKLNTNESPYPPSPAVAQALSGFDTARLRTYPNATADPLRDQIAQANQLQRQQIVITHGGDEALRLAFTTFVEPGANFGMAEPSYSLYPVLAQIQDAKVVSIDLDEQWQLPTDAAVSWNRQQTQLVCVVNPHAPSGALLSETQIDDLATQLNGVLLLDEAYADFVDPLSNYDSASLVQKHPNLLILRTFSKGYGLAGLRLGYLLGDAGLITPIVEKSRDSYNIDPISQALGEAAFADQAYARQTWAQVREDRQLGFNMPPSQANFVLAQVPAGTDASVLYQQLKAQNILVRYFDAPRLRDKLRITVGTSDQNQQLIDQLSQLVS